MEKEQQLLSVCDGYGKLDEYLISSGHKKILLVCGNSIHFFRLGDYFDKLEERTGIKVIKFCDFQPNPTYESVVSGVDLLKKEGCTMVVAVGGGSAMDVAKCIKLYANMDQGQNYLKQQIVENNIDLMVAPTTAGTGSEATRFAVIYYNGEKQSVSDYSCIPSVVIIDPSVLKSLPDYQRKSSMLDALCHAVESLWSVNSTDKSSNFACQAISMIMENMDGYLDNDDIQNSNMLVAANLAGKAINITQTTAGHAMCYKLTSLYGIAHGHAAALCVSRLFPYMVDNMDDCIDARGKKHLESVFECIAETMGCKTVKEAVYKFESILNRLALAPPKACKEDFEVLRTSVNPERLGNNPVKLDEKAIDTIYHKILK